MGISVQNITGNTAMVIWPSISSCADSFYSVMYQSNWNTMMSEYSKKNFQKEERIPTSKTSFTIENLTPLTTYITCVTCQSAIPSSDQCRIFQTLDQDHAVVNSKKKDLALGIWLTSSILLLIIACIMIYGCLHIWWRKRQERVREENTGKNEHSKKEAWTKNDDVMMKEYEEAESLALGDENKREDDCPDEGQLNTITKHPLTLEKSNGLKCTDQEELTAHISEMN
ncbi:hypothetical protein XENTR_v10006355 [Xenopus tropicalis]|uniref:Fibronectin type III domain containing 9 n=1 Tax=Xenopus tropicalis TaxID=8364 RepID=A0A6I8QQ30_XENTR|nr:fibronectin type III domain-containing protein 9 [Xenopus tropicalis]KAE8625663.1 hypothetical protein XENTR_v10006355 [Xenopus tropicalis]|eukprot:XP_004911868.1 PREDICTED: fibronectin type III domain-containing protein 9 [Xenopus tropicalis]